MRRIAFFILVLLSLKAISQSYPVQINTIRYLPDYANGTDITTQLKNLIAACSNGDVIVIPAGRFAVTGQIDIVNKEISIIGSGNDSVNGTMLYRKTGSIANSNSVFNFVKGTSAFNNMTFVSGIYFKSLPSSRYSGGTNVTASDLGLRYNQNTNFLVTDNTFQYFGYGGVFIYHKDSIEKFNGLIFNNSFLDFYRPEIGDLGYGIVMKSSENKKWITNPEFGSTKFIYVEDNIFRQTRHAIAGASNGKYVFRYNTVIDNWRNAAIDMHGVSSSNPYSTRATESYNNHISCQYDTYGDPVTSSTPGSYYPKAIDIRGGEALIHNNTTENCKMLAHFILEIPSRGAYPCVSQIGYQSGKKYGASDRGYSGDHGAGDVFIWNNNYTQKPLSSWLKYFIYPNDSNYLKYNRDIHIDVAKQGYTPYIYPHNYRNYYYSFAEVFFNKLTDVRTSNITQTSVQIKWNNVLCEDGYYVYKSTDGSQFSMAATTSCNDTTVTISGLAPGTQYWFRIRPFNDNYTGTGSNAFSITTASDNSSVPVSGISVSGAGGANTITTNGGTLQLSAAITPANASNKAVTWTVINGTGMATISSAGLVTAVSNGTVTARATAKDGSGASGSLNLTISNQTVLATGITVTGAGGATAINTHDGTLQLNATVLPSGCTNKSVTWSIINGMEKAAISSAGMVTAIANGTVTCKATANDGSGVSGSLSLIISNQVIAVTSLSVSGEDNASIITDPGESLQLYVSVLPADATDKSVTWSLENNTGQASINADGLVTATDAGTVTAKATANDGSGVSGSLVITVQTFQAPAPDPNIVYIDPTNQDDPYQDGSMEHPYRSWGMIKWKEGHSYLQRKGTISYESKINVTAGDVILGSYGEGEKPLINSDATDFTIRAYEKKGVLIKDLHIIALNAISCIYIIGPSSDSLFIENCTLESPVNGVRILDGKNVTLRYNTFVNCSDAIYCYAKNSTIYYNVFRDNEVAINAMASMASAEIYNNVFYNNTVGISNTLTDLTLYNNIFYLVNSTDKAIQNNQMSYLVSDNNIFYPEQEGFIQMGVKVYGSLGEYQQEFGMDMNSFTDDPEFMDANNQNYSLRPGSPAVDAGKNIGLCQDFYGTEVPSGRLPDIGLAEVKDPSDPATSVSGDSKNSGRRDFKVFPNPSNGKFNIFVKNNKSDISKIIIRDLCGKIMFENSYVIDPELLQEIDISCLKKGVYIIAVEDKTGSVSQPIVIL